MIAIYTRHGIFSCIFVSDMSCSLFHVSQEFVPYDLNEKQTYLDQVLALCRSGENLLHLMMGKFFDASALRHTVLESTLHG